MGGGQFNVKDMEKWEKTMTKMDRDEGQKMKKR